MRDRLAALSEQRLFIIGRDHPGLYERAVAAFGTAGETRVIYDRRLGQRRHAEQAPTTERRCEERRKRADVHFDIKAFGSALVRL